MAKRGTEDSFPEELTVEQAARLLHYKEGTLRTKMSKGEIPFNKYGYGVRIPRDQISELIRIRAALVGSRDVAQAA